MASPTSIDQMIVPRVRCRTWAQPGERGQDLEPADDDLDRVQDRGPDREPDEGRMVALRAHGDDRRS